MNEAKMIRTELKEKLNLNNRDVSVRSRDYSAVYVTIKNEKAFLLKEKIKNIAESYENYDRCEVTGEILLGGNSFVFVEYDNKIC